jgi:GntR family transcriptional regulator of vanillate catabolism
MGYYGSPRFLEVAWMSKPGQLVLVTLRKMIASGELAAGERLMEVPTAELFGVSRMPVRMAFRTLEQEGLLVRFGGRGFQVRSVSADDIAGAVEVRGVLEGLAARQAAERGLSPSALEALQRCLLQGDQLFDKGFVTQDDLEVYHDLNMRFHQVIIEGSHNPAIADALARNDHLPFASVTALAVDRHDLVREYRRFNFAHMQHHAVFDALVNRQGARAEAIMREHANATLRYAETFGSATADARMKVILRSE